MTHVHAAKCFTFDDPAPRLATRRRLLQARHSGLLGPGPHPVLDNLTRLAARAAQTPTAAVSLVGSERQVLASVVAPEDVVDTLRDVPVSHSLCAFVVVNDAPLAVEDARLHPVLHDHPAVVENGVVAYAGHPVHDPTGEVLGALCVIDSVPRVWNDEQLAALRDLATAVETKIALRLSRRETLLGRERLMQVLGGTTHTMIVIADADGVVTTVNGAARRLLGLGAFSLPGSWTIDDLAATSTSICPGVALDQPQDWTLRQPDGSDRVVSVRLSALREVSGELDGYVLVGDDLSERREAEQVLRDTIIKQAEAVRRLEAVESTRIDFIATASHELRTPVTSIVGFLELLADGGVGELTGPQRSVVDRIERNSHRLLHLVEDLLILETDAAPAPAFTEVRVDVLVAGAWDSLQTALAGRDLRCQVDVADDVATVPGDPGQLQQVLANLLGNAVKFTPDGGSVQLSVHQDEGRVRFRVIDTGLGIAPEEQAEVFQPLFRTRAAQAQAIPGAGVGLAVVRRIVEAHGGAITLESDPAHGTTVTVSLPLFRPTRAPVSALGHLGDKVPAPRSTT